ncbi:hypothetical protein BN7_3282 [Wickerhamomyces ciferrii]|uniref:Uncharacterized protein n=1 Tax=Wickerhamomyces ciferrii (strain ATCC 14091 / BCRC 22168 / CBS 111 / JCM 3599 / NBRC 0793 / NRRL Y-1031 F-60-10) TaxID=1206466 RepID=K0KR14_WICCF|nr:uncharacterized protein BN7_3282 [Wickerhamomyces ciferrii]CCH43728.1 hypothetical protein BN7_3282 [Wickerhamomyces ciferrii]
MGTTTSDAVYEDAERRFKEIEIETKKLSDESKKYFNAVNGMLTHQIGFSKAMEEIFKPISGKLSDPNSTIPEDNPDGIEASEQYREVVGELQSTLKPDLELIDSKIVKPAQELLKIIQMIRKMSTKRAHKQLDLDRHLNNYNKIEAKKEKTPKDEEKLYKAEADVQIAQEEYDYYNNMLKEELPILFQLEAQFVQPLFVSFYFMQLNIFYTLYNKFEDMKIPYFDLNSDIEESFNLKRGDIEEQVSSIGITHFKVGHARAKLELTKRRYGKAEEAGVVGPNGTPISSPTGSNAGLPAYTPPTSGTPGYTAQGYPDEKAQYASQSAYGTPTGQYASPYGQQQQPQQAYSAPPAQTLASPPPSGISPPVPQGETCTALYDYAAQAEGDLSFSAGSVITIVQRTQDSNGWWTGSVNGQTGVFPGNYVQLN